jgi:DNA-directed RNA polymerase I subunit RPA1
MLDVLRAKFRFLLDVSFDSEASSFVVEFMMDARHKKPLMGTLIEEALSKAYVQKLQGVSRVTSSQDEQSKVVQLTMEGNTFSAVWSLPETMVNMRTIKCNDVGAILRTYGVEAARNSIQKELAQVFVAYGIPVDMRHLGLIADYMTNEGGYKPFNRMGIMANTTPFGKMTFETTMKFMTESCLEGDYDSLKGPSSRIVLGQVVKSGTGCFDIMVPLQQQEHQPPQK